MLNYKEQKHAIEKFAEDEIRLVSKSIKNYKVTYFKLTPGIPYSVG